MHSRRITAPASHQPASAPSEPAPIPQQGDGSRRPVMRRTRGTDADAFLQRQARSQSVQEILLTQGYVLINNRAMVMRDNRLVPMPAGAAPTQAREPERVTALTFSDRVIELIRSASGPSQTASGALRLASYLWTNPPPTSSPPSRLERESQETLRAFSWEALVLPIPGSIEPDGASPQNSSGDSASPQTTDTDDASPRDRNGDRGSSQG